MQVITDEARIEELLTRSISTVLPDRESFSQLLQSGQRIRIYIGTDATGTSLHLGHATNYLKLEQFRRLGHEVIFLVGDFTSRIGDPTDKSDAARTQLSREEVVAHTKTWLDQVRPIIDIENTENPVRILYNHDWLAKLSLEDVIELSSHFTVQQMIERDMFEKRLESGQPLYLHELLYPLMQGYDSVEMEVDAELCGTDQTFNALAGRTLLRQYKNKEKYVLVTTLLENPKTGEKMMSKSQGTGVFLDTDAQTMYGAIMAQPDENMRQLFTDCTLLPLTEIDTILQGMEPRDAKMHLAKTITMLFKGEEAAEQAEQAFVETFQKGGVPDDIVELGGDYVEGLLQHGLVASKSELSRLIAAGGVKNAETGEKLDTIPTTVSEPLTLKIGKRRFVRLVP